MKNTLFLFIDESGNFDFSPKGTKYFVLTGMSTFIPVEERSKLLELRYRLLEDGVNQEYFHATEDKQSVRDNVFELIISLKDNLEVHSVIAQKRGYANRNINKIIVVLGAIFTKDKQSYILKTLKKYLKENFSLPFEVYFHQSQADLNSQLADYFGWSIYVKYERNEERPYKLVKSRIKSRFEIFSKGSTVYYKHE